MSRPTKLFKKLKPIAGGLNPCACCPPILSTLSLDRRIAVGFGDAHLECDGKIVWDENEDAGESYEAALSVAEAEKKARRKPNADWRIVLYGPLHGEQYQRHGKDLWVLVERNQGFA